MAKLGLKSGRILSSICQWSSVIFIWIKANLQLWYFRKFHEIRIEHLLEYPVQHHVEHPQKLLQNLTNLPKYSRNEFLLHEWCQRIIVWTKSNKIHFAKNISTQKCTNRYNNYSFLFLFHVHFYCSLAKRIEGIKLLKGWKITFSQK